MRACLVLGSRGECSAEGPGTLATQGTKGRVRRSQLQCVVMVVTRGAVAAGHRVGETGETGRMGGFSLEEG